MKGLWKTWGVHKRNLCAAERRGRNGVRLAGAVNKQRREKRWGDRSEETRQNRFAVHCPIMPRFEAFTVLNSEHDEGLNYIRTTVVVAGSCSDREYGLNWR